MVTPYSDGLDFYVGKIQQDHPLPQDFADMLGWRELTEKAAKAYHTLDSAEQNQAVPGGDNFGESGALDYYGAALHLPSPIGTSASYLLWTPDNFYRHNILVLASNDRGKTYSDYTQEFQSVVFAPDSVTTPYTWELGSYIIVLKYPTEKFRKEWQDDYINRRKKTSLFH